MMQVVRQGDWYSVTRITGPQHNLLSLLFGWDGESQVEALPVRRGEARQLSEHDVRTAVENGIEDANAELGVHFRARGIRYVPSDTPPASVYRLLAKRIVQAAVDEASALHAKRALG